MLAALHHVVSTGNEAHRFYALRAIARLKDPFPEWVVDCLYDQDPDLRIEAVRTIGELNRKECIDHLVENLRQDPDGEVKCEIIEACTKLKATNVIPLLNEIVSTASADVLSEEPITSTISWQEIYETGWDTKLDAQIKAIEALGQLGAKDSAAVIADAMLDELGQDLRGIGAKTLALLGDQGKTSLIHCFEQGNDRLKRLCLKMICNEPTDSTVAFIQSCSKSADPEIKGLALEAIGKIKPNHQALQDALQDADSTVRKIAIASLDKKFITDIYALYDNATVSEKVAILTRALTEILSESTALTEKQRIISSALTSSDNRLLECLLAKISPVDFSEIRESVIGLLNDPTTDDALAITLLEGLRKHLDFADIATVMPHCNHDNYHHRMSALTTVISVLQHHRENPEATSLLLHLMLPNSENLAVTDDKSKTGIKSSSGLDIKFKSQLKSDSIQSDQQQEIVIDSKERDLVDDANNQTPESTLERIIASAGEKAVVNNNAPVPEDLAHKIQPKRKHVILGADKGKQEHINVIAIAAAADFQNPEIISALWELSFSEHEELSLAAMQSLWHGIEHQHTNPWLDTNDYADNLTMAAVFNQQDIERQTAVLKLSLHNPNTSSLGLEIANTNESHINFPTRFESLNDHVKAIFMEYDQGRFLTQDMITPYLVHSKISLRHQAAKWLHTNASDLVLEKLTPILFDQGGADYHYYSSILRQADQTKFGQHLQRILTNPEQQYFWRFALESL